MRNISSQHPTGRSSQPLFMTRFVWGAIAGVMFIGMVNVMSPRPTIKTLDYLNRDSPVILRSIAETHRLPFLGVDVTLPPGWTYLSVTDDVAADQPTFVHESTHSILRLQRFQIATWPPAESEVVQQEFQGGTMEWARFRDRSIGRWKSGDVDLMLITITHDRNSGMNESIAHFCDGITAIDAQ